MAEKIIVASGKGGSGKTSFCTGVALSLAKKGHSVLVVDCDIAQGCIDFMLGSQSKSIYNWGDVILGNCKASEAIATGEGVDYFTAPDKWNDSFTSEALNKMIKTFEGSYSYILFDSPAGILGGFLLAANCADRAIIVTTPDEICVKAAGRATTELFNLGLTDIRLVINRFDKAPTKRGMFLNIDEAIDGVGIQLIGVVPEDKEISYASTNGFANLSDCPAKAAYERIATRITGKYAKLVLNNKKSGQADSPVLRGFLLSVAGIIIAAIIALIAIFLTDFHLAHNLKEPMFEIKSRTVQVDESTTKYRGLCYDYNVVKDSEGNIIATEMKVGSKTVSATVS